MKAFKGMLATAIFFLSPTLFAANSSDVTVLHYETLQRLNVESGQSPTNQKIGAATPVTLSFDALGRTFDLRLEPNDGLLSASSRIVSSESLKIYRGRLAGASGSWVRIVSLNGMPRGLIWDGEQMFAIEAPGDSELSLTEPVIYRLADTLVAPGTLSCGNTSLSTNGATVFQKLMGELSAARAQAPGAFSEINFGAIGDFEFTDAMGSGADAAIIARLNNVDGIFSEQLGVQITIQVLETYSDSADPFTDTLDASTLLDELATYRQDTPAQNSQGLTHLYTGRNLDSSTVGIAYGGALCRQRFGAGLSEGNRGITTDSLIAAHEIGHNFGAPHDGEAGSACEAEAETFLMAPSITGSDQFSACSIAEMQDHVATAACITSLPSIDMTVSLSTPSPATLLGNTVTLTFDVTNNGTIQASNVAVDATLPNNVSFLSAASSVGSCTNGAGTINCVLGDVPGSSGRTVTVTSRTTAVGAGVFDVTVSADVDDNPGNNQLAAQINVDPAVDLVVNTPTSASVVVDQSTTVSVLLENRSILEATTAVLSISLDSGLRADSATWSAGNCTVSSQQIDCQGSSLAAQSSTALDIAVTGTAAGTSSFTVTLSSNEADANPSDNSANGSITVSAVNNGSAAGEGGAGASGPLLLWLLAWGLLIRSRRQA
ncbi:MAG: DUF11 domain-containing protein [Gammaproteobacteria bacterium]|nr:DUF11 domain-containing protein [Gammaproteobacteria bacterium]